MSILSEVGREAGLSDDSKKPTLRDALHLGAALRLVWRAAPGWTALSAVVAIVQGVVPLLAVYLMKLIVDAVTAAVAAPDHDAALREVLVLVALAGLVGLAAVLLRAGAALANETLGQTVTDYVSDVIHAQSIAVDLAYYENSAYYDTLHRAQQEAPTRPTRIVTDLFASVQSAISVIAMSGLLVTLHWAVGLVVVLVAIPGALVRVKYSRTMYAWQRQRTMAERQSWYLHWLLTSDASAKEVRVFGLGDFLRGMHRDLRGVLRKERLGIARRRALAELATGGAVVLAVFGTFAFIVWETILGVISLGAMVMYYQAFQTGLSSLQSLLGGLAALYEDNLFLTNYGEFMKLEPRAASPAEPVPLPRPVTHGLCLSGVGFRYPDTDRVALADVSLEIRLGEVTAVVGANGSGKTTLVKLLSRLYEPTAGVITLDGVDIRSFDAAEVRRHIGVVFQDFSEYQFTARENIRIGDVERAADDPAIAVAARDAGADEVIQALPHGYDTVLGKWFADGEELSGGEWQKIAVARAFVRDAEFLIFDEPTSALDAEAEWAVFREIKARARGRAVMLVSHRFSTVRGADRIHIMDEGRLVESGTHDELVSLGGRYAQMYAVQARAFRESPL